MTNTPQPTAESTLSLIPHCIAFASAVQSGNVHGPELGLLYLKAQRELEVVLSNKLVGGA